MNMKNENAKLVFIYSLLGSVESCTDVTHKIPAKVYFNFPISDLDIGDQKTVLAELKKKKIIASFKPDDGDFVISKPSRSMLSDYYFKLKDKPGPKPEKLVDTKIRFDEKTGFITMGAHKPCPIVINSHHYFVCKLLFTEKFGTRVTETDILDQIDYAKESKRRIYDAMRAVNKKIKTHFGIERFIHWKTGRVWIDYQQS
jgi:hypothetical protein